MTNESRVIELIIRQSWHITLNPPLSFIIPKKKHKCKLSQDIKPIQLNRHEKDNTGFSYGPYNINNTHKRDLMTSIMTLTISRHTWEEIDHMTYMTLTRLSSHDMKLIKCQPWHPHVSHPISLSFLFAKFLCRGFGSFKSWVCLQWLSLEWGVFAVFVFWYFCT